MRIASKPERVGLRQPRPARRWVAGIATSRFPLGRKEVKEGVYRERDNQQSACATNHSTKRNGRLDEFIAWGKGCPYGCGVWNTRVERLWAMRNRDGSLRSLLADSISLAYLALALQGQVAFRLQVTWWLFSIIPPSPPLPLVPPRTMYLQRVTHLLKVSWGSETWSVDPPPFMK